MPEKRFLEKNKWKIWSPLSLEKSGSTKVETSLKTEQDILLKLFLWPEFSISLDRAGFSRQDLFPGCGMKISNRPTHACIICKLHNKMIVQVHLSGDLVWKNFVGPGFKPTTIQLAGAFHFLKGFTFLRLITLPLLLVANTQGGLGEVTKQL